MRLALIPTAFFLSAALHAQQSPAADPATNGTLAAGSSAPQRVWQVSSPDRTSTPRLHSLPDTPAPAFSQDGVSSPGDFYGAWNAPGGIGEFLVLDNPVMMELAQPGTLPGTLHGSLQGGLGFTTVPSLTQPGTASLPSRSLGATLGGAAGSSDWFAGYTYNAIDRRQLLSEMLANSRSQQDAKALADSHLLTRFDRRLTDRDSLGMRYDRSTMAGNLDGVAASPGSPRFSIDRQMLSAHNAATFSPDTVNETQAQWVGEQAQLPPGAPVLPLPTDAATLRRYRVYEAADNLYHQMGRQSLHAGAEYLYNQVNLSALEAGLGRQSLDQSSRDTGLYLMNQWKVTPALQLTAGARYDLQSLGGIGMHSEHLGPQVGFAWSPGRSSTVLRGGYGVRYAQVPLPTWSGAWMPGAALASSGTSAFPGNGLSPVLQTAYMQHASLELEQSLGARSLVSAGYEHVSGIQLTAPVLRSGFACTSRLGCLPSGEPGGVPRFAVGENSAYDAVTVSFVQHPAAWGDYRLSWTRATVSGDSSVLGDTGEDSLQRASFLGSLHTSPEAGAGWWDAVTHRLILSGYGDLTSRSELPGLDFVHLNARLTKTLAAGQREHLEWFAQTAGMFEERRYSMTQALADLNAYGISVLSSYARYAAMTGAGGTQTGLRLVF